MFIYFNEKGIQIGTASSSLISMGEDSKIEVADYDESLIYHIKDGVVSSAPAPDMVWAIDPEIAQAEYIAQTYARNRAEAYPSLTEQADMAYWDRQNGTTTLDDAIKAVKDAYPKPVA